ncbi:MAG: hypothetical protein OXE02_04905 [Chloroflexi bacterium]|nr:hypothetical protein [Chloroflexota bacterium]
MEEIQLGAFTVQVDFELLTPEVRLTFEPARSIEQRGHQSVAIVLPIGLARDLLRELSAALQEPE